MSERDYNKQVAKRQRIRSTTLVVGVDVGKAYNAVGFMIQEGKVLGSCAKAYNSREGFVEPTGHYWRKLFKIGTHPIFRCSCLI